MQKIAPWITAVLILLAIYGLQARGFLGGDNNLVTAILGLAALAGLLWRRPDLSGNALYRTVIKVPKAKALVIGLSLFLGSFAWLLVSLFLFQNGYVAMVPFVIFCVTGIFICVGVGMIKLFEFVSGR